MSETPTPTPITSPLDIEKMVDLAEPGVGIPIDPTLPVSQQIEASAGTTHDDLVGLSIENDKTRYVVIDAGLHSKTETSSVKDGPRRLVMEGSTMSIQKRPRTVYGETTETPTVIIATYDVATGDPLNVDELPREDFYGMTDEMGDTVASWPEPPETTPEYEEIDLHLGADRSNGQAMFESLTEQLEAHDATSWAGVTWERGSIKQEIIWDSALRKRATKTVDPKWVRTFAIKTTRGGHTISIEKKTAFQMAEQLKKLNEGHGIHARPMRNLRLARDKVASAESYETGDGTYSHYAGWLAMTPTPEETDAEFARVERLERLKILKEAIRDRSRGRAEESLSDEDIMALWLLDYSEVSTESKRRERVKKLLDIDGDKDRLELFKTAISGLDILDIRDTFASLRDSYLESMKKLGVPLRKKSASLSKIADVITDKLSGGEVIDVKALLGSDESAEAARRDFTDELVGRTLTRVAKKEDEEIYDKALIKLDKQLVPTTELTEDNQQPKYAVKKTLEFNKGFFSTPESPAVSKPEFKTLKQREDMRRSTMKMAHDIYDKLHKEEPVGPEEYADLGRAARRLMGE